MNMNPSRLIGMFTTSSKRLDGQGTGGGGGTGSSLKVPLSENVSKGLILLCIELCRRKQAARVLEEVKTKEGDKLSLLIENGTATSKNFSEIIDTNVLWTCLVKELDKSLPLINKQATSTIIKDESLENLSSSISNLPPHHKKLMGALIPLTEALGEGNGLLAEKLLRDIASRVIEPCDTEEMNERAALETSFVRLAVNTKFLFPYTRQFYMDAGVLEIPNSTAFWDLVADHRPEGVLAISHSSMSPVGILTRSASTSSAGHTSLIGENSNPKLERTLSVPLNSKTSRQRVDWKNLGRESDEKRDNESPPHLTIFDQQRKDMNLRLNIDDDGKSFETEGLSRNRKEFRSPASPPPNVPIPSGCPPTKASPEDGISKPIFLVNDEESRVSNQASLQDLHKIYEKCCVTINGLGKVADISSLVRELRSTFGSSSTELRNQLIEFMSTESNTSKITWAQLTKLMSKPEMKNQHLIFQSQTKIEELSELDLIPTATSHYREPGSTGRKRSEISNSRASETLNSTKQNIARSTPVQNDWDDLSELDSPISVKGREVKNQDDFLGNSLDSKPGRRARRERRAPDAIVSIGDNSWDSDSTGTLSPDKADLQKKGGFRGDDEAFPTSKNNSKLPASRLRTEENSEIPVFLQPFKPSGMSSPEIKRNANNNTPANGVVVDEVLEFSGEYSPAKVPSNRRTDSRIRQSKDRLQDLSDPEMISHTAYSDKKGSLRNTESQGRGHSTSPAKKVGRRGGEERKRLADLNTSGDQSELDASWDDLIPTLEEESRRRNLRQSPNKLPAESSQKLLSFAVSNSAKLNSLRGSTVEDNQSGGLRNHFRRENSEAGGLGGFPVEDLDISVLALDALPDTILMNEDILSPFNQEDPSEVVQTTRRKPKPKGMFALTAVDTSMNSIEDIPELETSTQSAVALNTSNEISPKANERSAFNVVLSPKSTRSLPPTETSRPQHFFPDSDDNHSNSSRQTSHRGDLVPNQAGNESDQSESPRQETHSSDIDKVQSVGDLHPENELIQETPSLIPAQNNEEPETNPKKTLKKKLSGVFSTATKFLQPAGLLSRSNSRDPIEEKTRSRANSELSIPNSLLDTPRASLTDREDDSLELPLPDQIQFNQQSVTRIDAPVSTVDVGALPLKGKPLKSQSEELNTPVAESSNDGPKGIAAGIFSKTKNLTRSTSWGLKTFLGMKATDHDSGDQNKDRNLDVNSAEISDVGVDQVQSSLKFGGQNGDTAVRRPSLNSRPPSRAEVLAPELSQVSKPPLPQNAGETILPSQSERNSASRPTTPINSSTQSAPVNEKLDEQPPQIQPSRDNTPPLSPSVMANKSGPVIKVPSVRNTPIKKRDWDLDNQDQDFVTNLAETNDIKVERIVESNRQLPSSKANTSQTQACETAVKYSPVAAKVSVQKHRSSPEILPQHPNSKEIPKKFQQILDSDQNLSQSSLQSSKPDQEISSKKFQTMSQTVFDSDLKSEAKQPQPSPEIPIPKIENVKSPLVPSSMKQQKVDSMSTEPLLVVDNPNLTGAVLGAGSDIGRGVTSKEREKEIKQGKLSHLHISKDKLKSSSNQNDASTPLKVKSEVSEDHVKPRITADSTLQSSKSEFPTQRNSTKFPANYLDLFEPMRHSVQLKTIENSPIEESDIHLGLHQALRYRQEVQAKYSSHFLRPKEDIPDNSANQIFEENPNRLGLILNQKILDRKKRQKDGSSFSSTRKSNLADMSYGFSTTHSSVPLPSEQPKEIYPEFILEAFPHLRSDFSPLVPKPEEKLEKSLGQQLILRFHEREKCLAAQMDHPPLPSHIPLQIEVSRTQSRPKSQKEVDESELMNQIQDARKSARRSVSSSDSRPHSAAKPRVDVLRNNRMRKSFKL